MGLLARFAGSPPGAYSRRHGMAPRGCTIPKLLRPYFLHLPACRHHRELLGKRSHAAWETVDELIAAANADDRDIRPGMAGVVQTATDLLEWSPHVHALVSRGGWDREGTWVPVPYVDAKAAELLFRDKVISFLRDAELLSDERIEMLLSWQSAPSSATNTGFSVHRPRGTRCARAPSERRQAQPGKNTVTVGADDSAGTERLARYLLRPPLSRERMSWDADGSILYRGKARGRFGGSQTTFDAMAPQPLALRCRRAPGRAPAWCCGHRPAISRSLLRRRRPGGVECLRTSC